MRTRVTQNLVTATLKALYPDGGNIWRGKLSGDLSDTIEGMSVSFFRDAQNIEKIRDALRPDKTVFVDELDDEFVNMAGDLTEAERRGRIRQRFEMMFSSESRIALIQDTLAASGFPDVVVRTLGWYGAPESPYKFFPNSGSARWGAIRWGQNIFRWGATEIVGNAYLMINGGSIEYVEDPAVAPLQIEPEYEYWTEYLVVEGEAESILNIPIGRKEVFFELLYMLKPGHNHIILNAQFT